MQLNELTAISPVDGRYRNKTEELHRYFSEYGLIRYRVLVEIEYFIMLCDFLPQMQQVDKGKFALLRNIYTNFSIADAASIKEIEKTTNHDVKAVEYFVKNKMAELGIKEHIEFVHFGLTSQDINNTATPLSIKNALDEIIFPEMERTISMLENLSTQWKNIPMLAKTHGQPASPTRLGKEVFVFVERLQKQLQQLKSVPHSAKFGGATGNFNAHHVAYPELNWVEFGNTFVNTVLGLSRSQTTTQIEHYDNLAAQCDAMKRLNSILIDLCRDIWCYISMNYFKQKIVKGEVGSSTMPHKVNPIDFENAEGNLGFSSALFEHLAIKLPISRLQRDLTDSTVLRNVGVPYAHTLIALKSLQKGLSKLVLNELAITSDLEANWAVVTEAIQTILRREGYPNPYEALKELSRTHTTINQSAITVFIDSLEISEILKNELKSITPMNYTGVDL